MISHSSKQMLLTKVLEHFQIKVIFKLTWIANLLLFQQEKSLCLFERSSKKRSGSLKVITPVDEPTEWVNQIVVAIDPSVLKRERYQFPVIDDLLPD